MLLQDGVEERNTIHRNLAAYVHVIGLVSCRLLALGSTVAGCLAAVHPADECTL